MSTELAVVVIHGMGSHKPGYANELIAELKLRIGLERARRVRFEEILWADITEARQDEYINAVGGLSWAHRFVVRALGDASAYQRTYRPRSMSDYERVKETGTYFDIHERLASRFEEIAKTVDPEETKLVVLAHSLGGHIFSNYYWDVQKKNQQPYLLAPPLRGEPTKFERMDTLVGLVTFGCNIPLFMMALDEIEPIDFPPLPIKLSSVWRPKARWVNFYDPDDILGYPLKPIGEAYSKVVDEDVEIDVGGIFGWTPVSHGKYWTDNDFTRPVAGLIDNMLD